MKNPQKPNTLPPLPERTLDLSEEIAAEEEEDELETLDKDDLAVGLDPELTKPGLGNVTTWDEAPGAAGRRVEPVGFEDENDYARQLAESGVDLADNEQREIREQDERVEEAEEAAAESGKTR